MLSGGGVLRHIRNVRNVSNIGNVGNVGSAGDVSDACDAAPVRRENFPVASRLLPARYRRHLIAVYGFARRVDDIGDAGSEGDPGEPGDPRDRLRLLDAVDADLIRLYDGGEPRLPVIRALAPTIEACAIPAGPFHRLVEANRREQTVTRYDTFEDLLTSCELSANPVGHIVLHVFGLAVPERLGLSDRICSALQVIEHCQDVGEDFARGHIYVPGEDLRRFGCVEADLAAPSASPCLRQVIAFEVRRAAALLDEGAPLVGTLDGFARLAVAGYVAGGRATVAALEHGRHDVLGTTIRPHRGRLLIEWLRVLARGR
ncbi:squalene synthase HpnC [Planotetraspora mira]|uniref:Phytoene synthase n=1 Tax=Planotetraspora mira TaxID=58121 RepID=A0A8J3TNG3_9ACTN|nr:squalene synthase HpnC [Planotetraspora mira]GII29057.1 phytoene synthase [Planotetraspora mira]